MKVENGQIILEAGKDLTGITWTGEKPPDRNYELDAAGQARRGRGLFCRGHLPCRRLVLLADSRWVGRHGRRAVEHQRYGRVGERDVAVNRVRRRAAGTTIRLRVTAEKIEAWLDERRIVDVALKGNQIDTRIEMILSQPIGMASWRTKAALRDIRLRRLS